MSFESLGLSPARLSALAELGYAEPTPIQQSAIPLVLAGHDLMAGAQTGTGKTAAFALPLLDRLEADNRRAGPKQARVLVLVGLPNVYLIDLIFFVGSIFFTAAGYSQYFQSINAPTAIDSEGRTQAQVVRRYLGWQPRRIEFWATFPQFLGTLAFNVTTFAAFASVGWLGYEVIVWVPDYVGSILFLVSGAAAVVEFCHRLFCWKRRDLTWWIVVINFAGCVAFMLSAILAYYLPVAIFGHLATWSTIFTLIGAVCFFVGSYLMWPEMSAETA